MSELKSVLAEKIEHHRPRIQRLLKTYGDHPLGQVTIGQAIGGARGVKCLVTDISYLDPMEGIRFRGLTIPEVFDQLPKPPGKVEPYVAGFWYFLLTGDMPTLEQAQAVSAEFKKRRQVPEYVIDMLKGMPKDSHPMAMFSAGILAMQRESIFAREYAAGNLKKPEYWEATFEDAMNLMARLPILAAYIYRIKYKDGDIIEEDQSLGFGSNFAHMIGIPEPYDDVCRLYFILHGDHESGNVSAHAGHLVASALSDVYYAYSAAMNGLAGPLHGRANQDTLGWIQDVLEKMGGKAPTEDQLEKFLWETLNAGQVVPGYGHAVLRKTDPRYTAQKQFCEHYMPDDELFKLVKTIYKVAPRVLEEHGKAKNPWPNVDSISGVLQWHYGLREYDFYTVLFGIGRALGVLSNIVWDRALGYPIERPKSVTTAMLEEAAGIRH